MSMRLDLFAEAGVEVGKPEPMTTVRLGKREAKVPLRKQRREALAQLMPILKELEGKDIYIGSYDAGGKHFWLDTLKLPRLKVDFYPARYESYRDYIPSVVVLWGSRNAQVRIFTDYLVAVRTQDYQGYWHYLLDFRNGFYDSTIDQWKSHYACLSITRFKD